MNNYNNNPTKNKKHPPGFTTSLKLAILGITTTLLANTAKSIKLSQITNTSMTLTCSTGSGIIVSGWIQKIDDAVELHVDTGTRTGDSLNLMVQDNPDFTTSNTHMLSKVWTYLAMRYDSSCNAVRFFRSNNNDLTAVGSGSSVKFSKVMAIDQAVTNSFNLQTGTSKIDPALRLSSIQYGPTLVLEFETDTATNFNEIAFELALGPAFVSTLDRLWLYKQNLDFEDETVWKATIYNTTDEFTYFEKGNFNSHGALIKPLEVFRYKYIAPGYHHPSYYQNLNMSNFPLDLYNSTEPQIATTTTTTDPTTGATTTTKITNIPFSTRYFPGNDSIKDATQYLLQPQTLIVTPPPITPVYSLISPGNETAFSSLKIDVKFMHNFEDNTLKFNFTQNGDKKNYINFDLNFDVTNTKIVFVPSNDFHIDANTDYTDFTAAGLKEYVLTLTFSNFTVNHITTDVTHGRVGLKISLTDSSTANRKRWYTSIEDFQLISTEKYILEIKNIKGTEVSVTEIRVSDGGLDYETVKSSTAGTFLTNLNPIFGANPWAFQCPSTNYVDTSTVTAPACSTSACPSQFTSCYSDTEGSKCSSSGFLDLVGRTCTSSCSTSDKNKLKIETANMKECVSCLDQYCETCPDFYYKCETYKTGNVVKPDYIHFNQTDLSLRIRYEKELNYSRLGEYAEVKWEGYTIPTNYTVTSYNRTGKFDLMIFFKMESPFNFSNLDVKITRIINWNYGDPAVFYSILNETSSIYAGFYNHSGWYNFANSTAVFFAGTSKFLVIGGFLFNHEYMFRILKLWSYTQFLFYLNIELPLICQIFIEPFRWSIFAWFFNFFSVPYYRKGQCVHPFKFSMNSLSCGFWRNIGYNVNFWAFILLFKCAVSGIANGWEDHYNWYMMKIKGMNTRLSAEFLWKLIDSMGMELLLHLFLYLKWENLNEYTSPDKIGVFVFVFIMLIAILWTYVINILFIQRLKPKYMTADQAADKAHYVIKEEPKKDKDGNPVEKKEIECKNIIYLIIFLVKEDVSFINYGKWFFMVKKCKTDMFRRSFPMMNFTKQLIFISVLFWVHDYPIYQVLIIAGFFILYIVLVGLVRPFKLKKEHFKHFFFELPIAIAYGFTAFAMQKDFSPVRFFQVNTVFYLTGIGVTACLAFAFLYVNLVLFFYSFTGFWEWANKVTEKCRGELTAFEVNF